MHDDCDTDHSTRHTHSDVIGHLQSTRAHTAAHRTDNAHCASAAIAAAAAIHSPTTYAAHNSDSSTARLIRTHRNYATLRSQTARSWSDKTRFMCGASRWLAMASLRLASGQKYTFKLNQYAIHLVVNTCACDRAARAHARPL